MVYATRTSNLRYVPHTRQHLQSLALSQETARTFSRPQVSKMRKMEVVEEEECLLNKSKEMMKLVLEENGQKEKL